MFVSGIFATNLGNPIAITFHLEVLKILFLHTHTHTSTIILNQFE